MGHKAGYVNILGKPNAGKSTLMNALLGERLSIVTSKAQTTRHRILGIYNDENHQVIFSDSPGIIEPAYKLQEKMMDLVQESLSDADVFLLVLDATDPDSITQGGDTFLSVINQLQKTNIPVVIAINKIDNLSQDAVQIFGKKIRILFPKAEILAISALHQFNTYELFQTILKLLPEHPPYFDKEDISNRHLRFFASEIIREKILENYSQEIPYSSHVAILSFKEEVNITRIDAEIWVEKESQKAIIIGKNGKALKKTGTEARLALEKFLNQKVYLSLNVKVKPEWRKNESLLNKILL
ncbi:MAG: GTPase Era [Flavobacteriales bacterium]|nr:GTPase Era [Flavobacteriales bacterium]